MKSAVDNQIEAGMCVMLDEDDDLIYSGSIYHAPFRTGAKVLLCQVDHDKLMAIVAKGQIH